MTALRVAFALVFVVSAAPYVAVAQTDTTPPGTIDESKPRALSNPAANPETDKSLSEKLKDNEGVLKPPAAADQEISKPAPTTEELKMPVIIPPGEPGGDQSIQPK